MTLDGSAPVPDNPKVPRAFSTLHLPSAETLRSCLSLTEHAPRWHCRHTTSLQRPSHSPQYSSIALPQSSRTESAMLLYRW
jgi:hypothetical protein